MSGKTVRVHWYEGDDAFGARALKIAEGAIQETGDLLGVAEEAPIDFFIYADQTSFYDALGPGTQENVGGQANAGIRTLFALITPADINDAWVGVVIPHELVHLVFDTAVRNPYHFPPRWLNEGLAVYQSQGYDTSDRSGVEAAARDGSIILLDGLAGQFPTTRDGFFLAYAESASAIDYLVRTYDKDALVALIGSYADGRTDDEAFKTALGVDTAEFGDAWLADLRADRPSKRGPQPAPEGPGPSSWSVGSASSASGDPGPQIESGLRPADRSHERPWKRSTAHPGRDRRDAAGSRCAGHRPDPGPPRAADIAPGPMSVTGRLRGIPSWQLTLGAALLGLGFLVAAQLGSEGPRVRYTSQERSPLVETAGQLQAQQEELKRSILDIRTKIQAAEGEGAGSAALVKDLNDRLQEARIAAGLIPLTGTGIVLQLEDLQEPVAPDGNEGDYLVGARDLRTVIEELWSAGAEAIAVNGERITPSTAVIDVGPSILVNSAYLSPPYQVTAIGPAGLYSALSARPGSRGSGQGPGGGLRYPDLVRRAALGRHAGLRRDRHAALCAPCTVAWCRNDGRVSHRPSDGRPMNDRRNQLTVALVAFVLGLLVVVQLRTQASSTAFAGLSSQDLTVLVANLNARNDQLRREISTLTGELATFTQNTQRGEASVDELRADLSRVRLYAGLDPATGPGVSIVVRGPIDGSAIEDLVNELRNAGAEAMAIDGLRVVPGVVVAGAAGSVSIEGRSLPNPFLLAAIGPSDKLTGSLTRSGGSSPSSRRPSRT
ncbi:MAG: DUF881 domain-containing protein [Candidatus Limnocylindrales bacterium]